MQIFTLSFYCLLIFLGNPTDQCIRLTHILSIPNAIGLGHLPYSWGQCCREGKGGCGVGYNGWGRVGEGLSYEQNTC